MKTKVKSIVSIILAVIAMSFAVALPVCAQSAATSSESVKIEFYKPDSWSNNIYIHLWNAGDSNTTWPGVAMSSNSGNSIYYYNNSSISSCNFVISDDQGHQTSDLYAKGYVGVKDNHVFEKSYDSIMVTFKTPSNWSSDVKIYYYTNDDAAVSLTSWPGKAMSPNGANDGYYANIYDMADIRVMFSDGTHQYPAQGQPGIPVRAGQELVFDQDKYTYKDKVGYNLIQDTTCAKVGEDYSFKCEFTKGSHFSFYFNDFDGNNVKPTSQSVENRNDKVIYTYTFNFAEDGSVELIPYYVYHSSFGKYPCDSIKINVIGSQSTSAYDVSVDKTNLNIGQEYVIKAPVISSAYYEFKNKNGQTMSYNRVYTTTENGRQYKNYVFTANTVEQYHTTDVYIVSTVSGYSSYKVGTVMFSVWQPAN